MGRDTEQPRCGAAVMEKEEWMYWRNIERDEAIQIQLLRAGNKRLTAVKDAAITWSESNTFSCDTILIDAVIDYERGAQATTSDTPKKEPQYSCGDCGKPIIQVGTLIPGSNRNGYYRFCEECRDNDVAGHKARADTEDK